MSYASHTKHQTGPKLFPFDGIDWVDEHKDSLAPKELIEAAEETGARRKKLAQGQGGFFLQYSTMPAGFEVPMHSHSFDELFIVVSGGCSFWPDGPDHKVELKARDSVTLAANHEYAFTCGPEGMEFYVVRTGDAGATQIA